MPVRGGGRSSPNGVGVVVSTFTVTVLPARLLLFLFLLFFLALLFSSSTVTRTFEVDIGDEADREPNIVSTICCCLRYFLYFRHTHQPITKHVQNSSKLQMRINDKVRSCSSPPICACSPGVSVSVSSSVVDISIVGNAVGKAVGAGVLTVGSNVGGTVGLSEGFAVGNLDGDALGCEVVGFALDGDDVVGWDVLGCADGFCEGFTDGDAVLPDGAAVGGLVGLPVDDMVGDPVGSVVGLLVGDQQTSVESKG